MNRKTIFTTLLALVAMAGHCQDFNTCQPIAGRILTAAQNHKPDGIGHHGVGSSDHFSN